MTDENKETPGAATPEESAHDSAVTSNRQQPEHSNRESQRLAHAQQLRSQAAEHRRRADELRSQAAEHRRRAAELRAQKPQPDA